MKKQLESDPGLRMNIQTCTFFIIFAMHLKLKKERKKKPFSQVHELYSILTWYSYA